MTRKYNIKKLSNFTHYTKNEITLLIKLVKHIKRELNNEKKTI